jgi:Na+/H+ antiporter NhaD/arsenite permease-like protein
VNASFLLLGALSANVLGTTGASMLLLRPLLRANRGRRASHVVVFFIFLVSNVGGLLTPIGDPPLFLGYLQGVPFAWPLRNLWGPWLLAVSLILAAFCAVDAVVRRREGGGAHGPAPDGEGRLSVAGKVNFLLLAAVVGAALLPAPWREGTMLLAAAASLKLTDPAAREENRFSWHPIREVAVLFAGIFATMMPALLLLEARGGELPVTTPFRFFWASGILSSFLDNAPTYLTFFHLGRALPPEGALVSGVAPKVLAAISAGSVFMGANSYIGNAPNFMVKALAEEDGVEMPSFPGYMAWSAVVLLPVFLVVSFAFFS